MRTWQVIGFSALFMLTTCWGVYGQDATQAPLPSIYPLPPASADFQAGFCAGWNAAQGVEQQRYTNWRALVTATRTEEGAKTPVGQTADVLISSVAVYVLVQPATGQLTLSDGRVVNCAAPAAGGVK